MKFFPLSVPAPGIFFIKQGYHPTSLAYRKIFVNRLNPYADHVCNLLPGGAFLQHQAAAFHYLLGHNSAAAAYAALSMESRDN